jgi:hypothetical protein
MFSRDIAVPVSHPAVWTLSGPLAHAWPYAEKGEASYVGLWVGRRGPGQRVWRRADGCAGVRVGRRGHADNRRASWLQRGPSGGVASGGAQPDSPAGGSPRDSVGRHLSAPVHAPGTLSHPGLSDTSAEWVSRDRHPDVHPGAAARKDDGQRCRDRPGTTADGPGRNGQLHARSRRLVRLRGLRRSRPEPLRTGGHGRARSREVAGGPEATVGFAPLQPARRSCFLKAVE